MSGTLYVSAAGAEARLTQLDVLANNLANAGTAGFRAGEVVFEAVLEAALQDEAGGPESGRTFVGTGGAAVRSGAGPVETTGRDLDAAIQGEGFFVVETPAGLRYTRSGSLQVDGEGVLTSASGHPVLGQGGPIGVGSSPVSIHADGSVRDANGNRVGELRIEEFPDVSVLARDGASLLRAPEGVEGFPVEEPSLLPRSLEGSNVQMVQDLARMVVVQRAFDAAMRTLEAEDAASSALLREI